MRTWRLPKYLFRKLSYSLSTDMFASTLKNKLWQKTSTVTYLCINTQKIFLGTVFDICDICFLFSLGCPHLYVTTQEPKIITSFDCVRTSGLLVPSLFSPVLIGLAPVSSTTVQGKGKIMSEKLGYWFADTARWLEVRSCSGVPLLSDTLWGHSAHVLSFCIIYAILLQKWC